MKLIKDKYYRVTDIYGSKSKMRFVNKGTTKKITMYCFKDWTDTLYISEDCIYIIESYKTITPQQQAKSLGKLDEYLKYMRINGKKARTKYIYKTVFTREQNKRESVKE